MKKLMFLSVVIFALVVSCEKEKEEKERTEQTVKVEVFWLDSNGVEVAPTVSCVYIFEDADFNFLGYEVVSNFEQRLTMTLNSGGEVGYKYKNENFTGHTHSFERVKNGQYCLVVFCGRNPWPYNRAYRRVTIDKDIHNVSMKFVFTDDDRESIPPPRFVEK